MAQPRVEPAVETHIQDNSIGWAWFEREPADGRIDADEAAAQATRNQWLAEDDRVYETEIADGERKTYDPSDEDRSWWGTEQQVGRAS